jgi:hypothetical protein
MCRIVSSTILALLLMSSFASASEESPGASATPGGYRLLHRQKHEALPGLPSKWDKRIPLPDGTMVKGVKPPVEAAQTVEFSVPGDYDHNVAFYQEELPKAGFELGPSVKVPARKVYSLNFTRAGVQDTLSIFPDKTEPSKLAMRIVYTPEKGWIRRKLAKWEDRARILPKWWRHREEEKLQQKADQGAAQQDAPGQPGEPLH